jgi:hypothetical protein
MLMAVLIVFLVAGFFGTSALAHGGHDPGPIVSETGVKVIASIDEDVSLDQSDRRGADATCAGHCCSGSICCVVVAVVLDAVYASYDPTDLSFSLSLNLMAIGPPDGPRRPPKSHI